MKTLTLTRSRSSDGQFLYITDATTTYGTDLPDRDDLALIPYFRYKAAAATAYTTIAPANFSPLDVVTFTLDVSAADGIYYGLVFALPRYVAGPLTEGDVVYDTNDLKVKKYISGVLTEITVASLVTEDVDFGELDTNISIQLLRYKNQLELIKLEKLQASIDHICEEQEYRQAKKDYDYVVSQIAGAYIAFCQGMPLIAQQRIEDGTNFAIKALKIA